MKRKKFAGNRILLALGAGAVATGAVAASAATLGDLQPQTLGSESAAVSGCQSGSLSVTWGTPTYSPTEPTYKISQVTLGGIQATCNNRSYRMTVAQANGASLAEVAGNTGSTGSVTANFPTAVDTALLARVTVTIYG